MYKCMRNCNVDSRYGKHGAACYLYERESRVMPCWLLNAGTNPRGGRDHSPFYPEAGYGREGMACQTTPYSIAQLCWTIHLNVNLSSCSKQVTPNNVDIAKVAPKYHLYTPAEVEAVIARLWNASELLLFTSSVGNRRSLYEAWTSWFLIMAVVVLCC